MALIVECPECKRRNSQKAKNCKCGFALAKFSGRVWWIEYYDHDKQLRRERIGPNKAAAEQRLREVLSTKAENRYIKKSKDTKTRFSDLCRWYLGLDEVRAKRSYLRDELTIKKNLLPYFGNRLLKDITTGLIENWRQLRLKQKGRSPGTTIRPATANREVATLKIIFNRGIRHGKCEKNPCRGLKQLKENNARDRVLSPDEFTRLLACCPAHLQGVVNLAYHTGMRKGEILSLKWEAINLREGLIKLEPEGTKTNEGRLVPLNDELLQMFRAMPRGLPQTPVFTFEGRPLRRIQHSFETACKQVKIENFVFHDFRHTFTSNMYKAGVGIPTIMAITGHKGLQMFLRYNTISTDDLKEAIGKI